MIDEPNNRPAQSRRPTVQSGGGLFGARDDRWDVGTGGTVDGPKQGWAGRLLGTKREAPPKEPPLGPSPFTPAASTPASSSTTKTNGDQLAEFAVPILILAFAIATSSIVLPIIAFALWLQRRKLAPHFAPPWEDPEKVQAWMARRQAKGGVSDLRAGPFSNWLKDPPYSDREAFRAWVRVRIGQAAVWLLGLALIIRALAALDAG